MGEPADLTAFPTPPPTPSGAYLATEEEAVERLQRRLAGQLLVRLLVATVLLGGTLGLSLLAGRQLTAFTPRSLTGLIVATYLLSAIVAASLRSRQREVLLRYARALLAWDLLLVTSLVYLSGGATSAFPFLYGIAIVHAALALGTAATLIAGSMAFLLYLFVVAATSSGWIPLPPDAFAEAYRPSPSELGLSVATTALGLFLVTGLAASLATRLRIAGGRIREAEAETASLAELHESIVRSIPSGVVTIDGAGAIRSVNPLAARLLAGTPGSLEGTRLSALLPVPPVPPALGMRGEGEARPPEKEPFPVGYTIAPLLGHRGEALVIFQDLTEVNRLRVAAERAERLVVLGRLAQGLAHEIRNPLGSIRGSVEMLREAEGLGEEDRALMGIVLDEVERLNELVSTMLDVGRPSRPRAAWVDLSAMGEEVLRVAQAEAARQGVRLEATFDPAMQGDAEVDAGQLRQVIWNLLKNAIQASPEGAVVSLRLHGDQERVQIEVADRGAGVPEHLRERLFEMFYSGRSHGIGLGLALVKQIVEAHGGTVDVDETEGGGATFRVDLPRRRQPSEPALALPGPC
ncbi:MAG: ATP-binding protein [Myxococcota bacterium]